MVLTEPVVALIGMFMVAVIFPTVSLVYTASIARRDRKEDLERQDQIAAKVEAAAIQAKKDAADLLDLTKRASTGTQTIVGRLVVIHDLVNSDMTARIESELAGLRREEELMTKLIDVNRSAGKDPTILELKEVGATQARIKERSKTLEQRKVQQDKIDADKAANEKLITAQPEAKT